MLTVGSKSKLRRKHAATPVKMPAEQAGFSSGINLEAGSHDDGWTIPKPIRFSDGTELQLYKDGEALRAAYEAIEEARRLVCVEMYIFADDATGNAFADLLAAKARAGVKVFCVYDCFASRRWMGFGPETPPLRRMRESGVRLEVFHPMRPWECRFAWHPVNRDHRKLFFVDEGIGGMGGLNIGTEYAGSWIDTNAHGEFWRDNGIGLRGPAARMLLHAFRQTWRYVHRGGRMRGLRYAENLYDDEAELGLLASAPTIDSSLRPMMNTLIRSAQFDITLTMAYFAPDDGLVDGLCSAAARGVRVRLMLPGISDVPLVRIAGHSFFDKMLDAGIEIYERQYVVLHAKTLCIDGRTTVIGSANLDYRSIEYNCELSAIVRSKAFGRQIHELFDNDVRYAKPVDRSEWRRRPLLDRVVQWAVSRARYVL